MTKIVNLLEKAIEAKRLYIAKVERAKANGRDTNEVFICHLFYGQMEQKVNEWQYFVEVHFDSACYPYNNIASYINDILGVEDSENASIIESVRLKWLDDLIAAAKLYGDDALYPLLMSEEEIKKLASN